MSRPKLLTDSEIAEQFARGGLEGWRAEGSALVKHYNFTDFAAAWGFMSRVALAAEKMDHHPNWTNAYNQLDVALSTHDTGGITELDFELARKMEALAS